MCQLSFSFCSENICPGMKCSVFITHQLAISVWWQQKLISFQAHLFGFWIQLTIADCEPVIFEVSKKRDEKWKCYLNSLNKILKKNFLFTKQWQKTNRHSVTIWTYSHCMFSKEIGKSFILTVCLRKKNCHIQIIVWKYLKDTSNGHLRACTTIIFKYNKENFKNLIESLH